MLLIVIFCIYVIAKGRVSITRNLTLTGTHARQFALSLLVLMIPVQLGANVVIVNLLSPSIYGHPVVGRLISVMVLALLAFVLALGFHRLEQSSKQLGVAPLPALEDHDESSKSRAG